MPGGKYEGGGGWGVVPFFCCGSCSSPVPVPCVVVLPRRTKPVQRDPAEYKAESTSRQVIVCARGGSASRAGSGPYRSRLGGKRRPSAQLYTARQLQRRARSCRSILSFCRCRRPKQVLPELERSARVAGLHLKHAGLVAGESPEAADRAQELGRKAPNQYT